MMFGGVGIQTLILAMIVGRCNWDKEVINSLPPLAILLIVMLLYIYIYGHMHACTKKLHMIIVHMQVERVNMITEKWEAIEKKEQCI